MLVDTRSLPDGSAIEADICIVGAGPAGLTIAKRLAARHLRIAILESGGVEYEPAVNALTDGDCTGIEIEPLHVTRLRGLGGTSAIWNGHCRMLDASDFEHRPWVPHSGWPFARRELEPYYAAAQEIMRLEPPDYDIATWSARVEQPTLAVDGEDVFNRVSLIRPVDFWIDYAADLKAAPDVAVHTHATVLAIRATEDGGSVDRLEVGTLEGKRLTARARGYVLACGGIENARLLLLSNDDQANGLGNQYDLVGRFFMEHPRFVAGMLLLSGDGLPRKGLYTETDLGDGLAMRADLGIGPRLQQREEIGNVLGRLRPAGRPRPSGGTLAARHIWRELRRGRFPDNLASNLWAAITDADEVAVRAYEELFGDGELETSFELTSYSEQAPNPDSRVMLSERRDAFGQPMTHLVWRLGELDRRTALRAVELFGQAFGAQDLGRVRVDVEPQDVFPSGTDWGHHHMGTTRMNDDPRQGVVDRDGKLHGISNLFVAGSSVFPTSGCATPTLTLVALAARLADHLGNDVMRAL